MAHLVLIAGGTAAGKTHIARLIQGMFEQESVCVFSHDLYYRDVSELTDDQLSKYNFDHPKAIDQDKLIEDIDKLVGGGEVTLPRYDFVTHRQTPDGDHIGPTDVLVVEGIFALAFDKLVQLADLRVFVDTDADLRLVRRLRRDVKGRGLTTEQVLEAYVSTVKPMHDVFVEPTKRKADIVIPGDRSTERAMRLLRGYLVHTLVDEAIRARAEESFIDPDDNI